MSKERLLYLVPITLLLLVCIGWLRPYSTIDSTTQKKRFWLEKTHTAEKFNMVIGGDSRIYRGIAPEIIEEILPNFSVFNFGYSSGSLSERMLQEMEEKIDLSNINQVIVLGITPHSLTQNAAHDRHFLEQKAQANSALFSYRYFYRLNLWTEPMKVSWLLQKALGKDKTTLYYQDYRKNGWIASTKIPANATHALLDYEKIFSNNPPDSIMIQTVLDYTKKWTAQGIKIFAFRPPTTAAMYALENKLSGFEEHTFINQFAQVGGKWIPVQQDGFESYDGSHLTEYSAVELSKIVANFVRDKIK